MPKSKREKKVTLSRTKGKGFAGKEKIVEDVRACLERHTSVYVYTAENLRNAPLKRIRAEWADSRLFFGRAKQLAVALGRTPESEARDGLSKISAALLGREGGLLFTSRPRADVEAYFRAYAHGEYARAGFVATDTLSLPAGPLPKFAHSIEPYLRKLGMPTKLDCGVVTLLKDYVVCAEGDKLNADQAKILQLLDIKLATFRVHLRAAWTDGSFEALDAAVDAE
jgi:mRNA turnover protein 4